MGAQRPRGIPTADLCMSGSSTSQSMSRYGLHWRRSPLAEALHMRFEPHATWPGEEAAAHAGVAVEAGRARWWWWARRGRAGGLALAWQKLACSFCHRSGWRQISYAPIVQLMVEESASTPGTVRACRHSW